MPAFLNSFLIAWRAGAVIRNRNAAKVKMARSGHPHLLGGDPSSTVGKRFYSPATKFLQNDKLEEQDFDLDGDGLEAHELRLAQSAASPQTCAHIATRSIILWCVLRSCIVVYVLVLH